MRAGRFRLAETYARGTLELTLGTDLWNAEPAGRWTAALVAAHLGRADAAREHAETGHRQAQQLGDLAFATRCSHVLGFLALSLGDADAAVRHLGGGSPARKRVSGNPSHCDGTGTPIASQIVGITSTFSVKCSTTVPWVAVWDGSRTMHGMA